MRKFLTLGVGSAFMDPTLSKKQQKQLYASVSNTGLVSAGVPSVTLSASVMRNVKTRTSELVYSGVSCMVSFTINGTAYQKVCYTRHSCIHIDLSDILSSDNFIDIMLNGWNAYFTYKIDTDVTINSAYYRFGSESNTRVKAQYYDVAASFQINEVGTSNNIKKIVYNKNTGKYLGRGSTTGNATTACTIYMSDDGLNWTQSTLDCPLDTELPDLDVTYKLRTYQSMEAVGNGFVILSSASRMDNEYCNMYHYTEDGINWKSGPLPRPSGITNRNIYDGTIQEFNGKYLAIATGQIGTSWSATGITETNWSVYTENGYDWNLITFPASFKWNEKIVKFKNRYYLTSSSGIKNSSDVYELCTMYSTDLINWTAVKLTCGSGSTPAAGILVHTDSTAFIVNSASNHSGDGDYAYFYSTNGTSWTKANTPNYANYSIFLPAKVINNTIVLIERSRNTSGLRTFYSTDAINWSNLYIPGTATSSGSSSVSGPLYVTHDLLYLSLDLTIDGTSRRCICYSKDGSSWATTTIPVSASGEMQYHTGLWLMGDTNSSFENNMMYSFDGTYWRKLTMIANYEFKGWEYINNRWYLYNDYSETDLPATIITFTDIINDYVVSVNEPSSMFACAACLWDIDNSANGSITVNYTLESGITKLLVQVNNGDIQDLTSSKTITVNKGDTIISSVTLSSGTTWQGWSKPNPYTTSTGSYQVPSGPARYYTYTIPVNATASAFTMTANTGSTSSGGNIGYV